MSETILINELNEKILINELNDLNDQQSDYHFKYVILNDKRYIDVTKNEGTMTVNGIQNIILHSDLSYIISSCVAYNKKNVEKFIYSFDGFKMTFAKHKCKFVNAHIYVNM